MSKSKHEEKEQDAKKQDKEHVLGGSSCALFSPESGVALTQPFDISGSSTCKNVVLTIFNCDTNEVYKTVTIDMTNQNNFFSYSFSDPVVQCSNAGIMVSCAEDASKFSIITGLVITSNSKKFHDKKHTINSALTIKLDTYDENNTKKLKCNVTLDKPNDNDVYFVRFIQINDYKTTPKKAKIAGKCGTKGVIGGYDVLAEHIVNKDEVYVAHVVYSDDTDVFCSFAAKLFT